MKTLGQIHTRLVQCGWTYLGGAYYGGASSCRYRKGNRGVMLSKADYQPRVGVRFYSYE